MEVGTTADGDSRGEMPLAGPKTILADVGTAIGCISAPELATTGVPGTTDVGTAMADTAAEVGTTILAAILDAKDCAASELIFARLNPKVGDARLVGAADVGTALLV